MRSISDITIHKGYSSALVFAVVLHLCIIALAGMVLDCGVIAQITLISALAFWTSVVMLIVRNPGEPKKLDLIYIRVGPVVVTIFGYFFTTLIWNLRGVW